MDASEWDARYRESSEGEGLWTAKPPHAIRDFAATLPPGSALDVATGDGRTALWLALNGWLVTGVDFSAAGLEIARSRPGGERVDWQLGDVRHWQPNALFDLVTAAYLHLPNFAAVLSRAAGWVAPDGHLVVLGHDVENIAARGHGPGDPEVLYTPDRLRSAVGSGFIILRCERLTRGSDDAETADARSVGVDTLLIARRASGPGAG